MAEDTPMSGYGTSSASDTGKKSTDSDLCPTCGARKSSGTNAGLDQFLGRIGISDEMIENLKTSMQSVDMEQYLDTARDYLKNGGDKAGKYAKENPGKVAAGVAVLAVGAGLLISSMNRGE